MRSVIQQMKAPAEKLFEAGGIHLYLYKPDTDDESVAADEFYNFVSSMVESLNPTVVVAHGAGLVEILNRELLERNLPDVPEFRADQDYLDYQDEWYSTFRFLCRHLHVLGYSIRKELDPEVWDAKR